MNEIEVGEYIDITTMAQHYGVSPMTIRRWWYEGNIPAPIRLGRRMVRWRVADIQAFDAAQVAHRPQQLENRQLDAERLVPGVAETLGVNP